MSLRDTLGKVLADKPLVCQITNYVTVGDCANITICAGGSPVMIDSEDDIEEMISSSSSLVLNIGTLNDDVLELMVKAGRFANKNDIPVVLDPVGAGATSYRTNMAKRLMKEVEIDVIKGNSGEISSLVGNKGSVRGVDSIVIGRGDIAKDLATNTGSIVCMTGPVDYVSDGKTINILKNGNPMLEKISGAGCMLSSVVGCYVGTHGVNISSVSSAVSVFTIASELVVDAVGPGTFRMRLFDSMYNLSKQDIDSRLRMETS